MAGFLHLNPAASTSPSSEPALGWLSACRPGPGRGQARDTGTAVTRTQAPRARPTRGGRGRGSGGLERGSAGPNLSKPFRNPAPRVRGEVSRSKRIANQVVPLALRAVGGRDTCADPPAPTPRAPSGDPAPSPSARFAGLRGAAVTRFPALASARTELIRTRRPAAPSAGIFAGRPAAWGPVPPPP